MQIQTAGRQAAIPRAKKICDDGMTRRQTLDSRGLWREHNIVASDKIMRWSFGAEAEVQCHRARKAAIIAVACVGAMA
jgi:hypothetical protein